MEVRSMDWKRSRVNELNTVRIEWWIPNKGCEVGARRFIRIGGVTGRDFLVGL